MCVGWGFVFVCVLCGWGVLCWWGMLVGMLGGVLREVCRGWKQETPHHHHHTTHHQDPTLVLDRYGADALRLYLINSPVVRAETLKFSEEGVKNVIKEVFLPWYNAYRFLGQNITRLKVETGRDFAPTKVWGWWWG